MTRPLRLLILICLMASPAETRASATLRWMTGDLNMAWVSAGLCTLGVQSPSGLPGEWRLVWRSDVPIELVRPDLELPRFGGRLRTAVDRELRGALFRLASPRPRTHAGA
jgi:hypothetical protein